MTTNNLKAMQVNKLIQGVTMVILTISVSSCVPELVIRESDRAMPEEYPGINDTTNSASIDWREYFADPYLIALIDTSLMNNQELNIVKQEVDISRNEVSARKGEYLPFLHFGAEAETEKVGEYTRNGATESQLNIKDGEAFPEPLSDYMFGVYATWEVDIWHKLRNAKQAAYKRYLSSIEGRNFLVTNLIAEIASTYYELQSLDNQLDIIEQNIQIQSDALEIVKIQKQSARVTELAVRRFEAQLLDTKSLRYSTRQSIIEIENRLNFLVGRYPQPIPRQSNSFQDMVLEKVMSGIPAQLLANRPDIRAAELNLEASKLDVASARANFYPSLDLSAGLGFQAFKPNYLLAAPESMMYSVAGGFAAPILNRKAINATYLNANAMQLQSLYEYEQTVLNAYIEVVNQLANMDNLASSYTLKQQQVNALTESVEISGNLFRSARADYMEVLLTQEEALESRFELVETKMKQLHAWISIYRALGGGWQ
jgi:multidrug efflux system outer membrane protein